MFLEQDQFICYRWLCERKMNYVVSRPIFMKELIAHYKDVKRNTFFSHLVNLCQKGLVKNHI